MASYGDAMVATAGLLGAMNLPALVQGYWTEHSERSVLPTGLSVLESTATEKNMGQTPTLDAMEDALLGCKLPLLTLPEGITMRTSTRGRSLMASRTG